VKRLGRGKKNPNKKDLKKKNDEKRRGAAANYLRPSKKRRSTTQMGPCQSCNKKINVLELKEIRKRSTTTAGEEAHIEEKEQSSHLRTLQDPKLRNRGIDKNTTSRKRRGSHGLIQHGQKKKRRKKESKL